MPSAKVLYRRTLAAQPDHSVVISSVGLLTNLEELLKSEPDEYSNLNGEQLLARKVRLIGFMAGAYPRGDECNAVGDGPAFAYVVSNLPPSIRVFFLGFEVGIRVMTGANLTNCATSSNPCRQAYIDYLGGENRARPSWDPLTTLVAVRGAEAAYLAHCKNCDGKNFAWSDGSNEWRSGPRTNQTYLTIKDGDEGKAANELDKLFCQTPRVMAPWPAPPQPPSIPFELWPRSPPPPLPPPPMYWQVQRGFNCFAGKGARDLLTTVSGGREKCQQVCELRWPVCTAFVVKHVAPATAHLCYLRQDVVLADCDQDGAFDTYIRALAPTAPPMPPMPPLPPGPPPSPPHPALPTPISPPNPPRLPPLGPDSLRQAPSMPSTLAPTSSIQAALGTINAISPTSLRLVLILVSGSVAIFSAWRLRVFLRLFCRGGHTRLREERVIELEEERAHENEKQLREERKKAKKKLKKPKRTASAEAKEQARPAVEAQYTYGGAENAFTF